MIAVLIALLWLAAVLVVLAMFAGAEPRSTCTGNCSQGRHCTCTAPSTDKPGGA